MLALNAIGSQLGHDAPAIQHGDTVAEGQQLVKVGGDEQDSDSGFAQRQKLLVHEECCADVEATRRLSRD